MPYEPMAFQKTKLDSIPESGFLKGVRVVAAAGQTQSVLLQIAEPLEIHGAMWSVAGQVGGNDTLTLEIIDHDDLLGYGADFVLDTFGETVKPNGTDLAGQRIGDSLVFDDAAAIPMGFYLRLTYQNTALLGSAATAANYVFRRIQ